MAVLPYMWSRTVCAVAAVLPLVAACTAAPGRPAAVSSVASVSDSPSSASASPSRTASPTPSRHATPLAKPVRTTTASVVPVTSTSVVAPPSSSANRTSSAPPAHVIAGTIVLNPGHNGGNASHPDEINRQVPAGFGQMKACDTTGTNTNAGYAEHSFNWDVTLRVRSILTAHGVHVILTRPSDDGVGPCVDERAAIGNQAGVAAVISIHADGADSSGHGFHVCESRSQPAGATIGAQSHSLTVAMHDALLAGSGLTTSTYLGSNGYYPRDDLAALNLATVPATFLEIGNMRNAGDAGLQSSTTGRQRIADSVAAGILHWLGRA